MKRALLLAAPLLFAARPASADACEAPPLANLVLDLPAIGEMHAPLDAVVVVTYAGTSPAIASPGVTLQNVDGSTVDATLVTLPAPGPQRRTFLLVPKQPLQPGTMYWVADQVELDCTAEPCNTALGRRWPFTTGTTTDTVPPLPPVAAVALQTPDVCTDASCCGPYHALLTDLENPASGAVRYDLYDSGTLVQNDIPFVISTDCARPGDVPYASPDPTVALAPGMHHLTLHAFDLSNNETVGTQTLDLDLSCDAVQSDSGGGGCSATGGGAGGWLLLAFVPLVARRGRRGSRNRRSL